MNYELTVKMSKSRFDTVNALLAIESFEGPQGTLMYCLDGQPDDNQFLFGGVFEDGTSIDVQLVSGQNNYYTTPEIMVNGRMVDDEDSAGFELSEEETYSVDDNTYTFKIELEDDSPEWSPVKLFDVHELADTLLADLGNGSTTMSGDKSSNYFALVDKGDLNYLCVCLTEVLSNGDEGYYSIHAVDSSEEDECELYYTNFLDKDELCRLLAEVQRDAFDWLYLVRCKGDASSKILSYFKSARDAIIFTLQNETKYRDDMLVVERVIKSRQPGACEYDTTRLAVLDENGFRCDIEWPEDPDEDTVLDYEARYQAGDKP